MLALASYLFASAAIVYVNATPASAPRAETQPCWTTYVSLRGDTCETIAEAFRVTTTDVSGANSFVNCNDIWPGTPLCIYGESQVTVTVPPVASSTSVGSGTCWTNYRSQLHDTCSTIGLRFGVTAASVFEANKFLDCNNIWEGTPITVCDGARTRTTVQATGAPTASWTATNVTVTPTASWTHTNVTVTPTASWTHTNVTVTPTASWTQTNSTTRATVTATPGPAPTTCWTTYISLQGDTCNSISEKFRITSGDVFDANTFLNCNDIWPGTPLCIFGKSQITVTGIPPSTPTTISGGAVCYSNYRSQLYDTCSSIGARFGLTAEQVYNANKFLNCADIWEGTPIAICK